MTTSTSRLAAAVLLTVGGMLAGVTAAAIVIARVMVQAGIDVQPADAALLDDLVAVLPFILAFFALNLATAAGLAAGRAWAVVSASLLTLGTVAAGVIGLVLVVIGNDPSVVTGAIRAGQSDGIGLITAFTGLYLSALIALRIDGLPTGRAIPATA